MGGKQPRQPRPFPYGKDACRVCCGTKTIFVVNKGTQKCPACNGTGLK